MCKGCSYHVSLSLSDHRTDAMDQLIAHGIEDKHLVFTLGHLAFVVVLKLAGEADQAYDRHVQ